MLSQKQQPILFTTMPAIDTDDGMTLEQALEMAKRTEYCDRCERADDADDDGKHGYPFDSCDECGAC